LVYITQQIDFAKYVLSVCRTMNKEILSSAGMAFIR